MRWKAGRPCKGRISPRGVILEWIALAALVAVGVAGWATAPAEAQTDPRTVTQRELTVEAPAGWSDISREGKPGLQFISNTGEQTGTNLSIWPFDVPPALRHRSPAEHASGYFAAERQQLRPRPGGRLEGWQEEVREIDGRPYPIMRFRDVLPPQPTGDRASSSLFLLYFPDDFATRQRFYVVMWKEVHPAGEVATGLEALDAFVRSIRLGPATAAQKVRLVHRDHPNLVVECPVDERNVNQRAALAGYSALYPRKPAETDLDYCIRLYGLRGFDAPRP